MKRGGFDRMFPFVKRDIENGVQDMSQKIINRGSHKVCRPLPCLPCPMPPKVTVLLLLVQLGHTKHCSLYKYIYFVEITMSGAVNPSTPHNPPLCVYHL